MAQPPALSPGCFGMASHGFLCRIPAQLLPWPSVFPQLQPQPVSPTVTGSILPCSILGTVTRALSFTHPTDHVTLAHPTAHLPYPCTLTCLVPILMDLPCSHSLGPALFPLSWPVALSRRRLSFGIKRNLSPASSVFKQATLSFLMCFQLGCAARITIYGSVRQPGCCMSWLCQARLDLGVWS